MRLLIIAAARPDLAGPGAVPGERDASLVRERFALGDLGFEVVTLDASIDVAEQLDSLFAQHGADIECALLYASTLVAVVDDGECFFCLDPAHPEIGDAIADVRRTIARRVGGPVAVWLEARVDPANAGLARLQSVAAALQAALAEADDGVEAVLTVRGIGVHPERMPSRLTAALLETLDEHAGALTVKKTYAHSIQRAELGAWPNVVLYSPGKRPSLTLRAAAPVVEESAQAAPSSGLQRKSALRRQAAAIAPRMTPIPDSLRSGAPEPLPPSTRRLSQPPARAPLDAVAFLEVPAAAHRAAVEFALAVPAPVPVLAPVPAPVPVPVPVPAPVPVLAPVPAPVPVPVAEEPAGAPVAAGSQRRSAEPKRAPPPSDRVDFVSLAADRGVRFVERAALPKVMISARVDARRRRTEPRPGAFAIEAGVLAQKQADGAVRVAISNESPPYESGDAEKRVPISTSPSAPPAEASAIPAPHTRAQSAPAAPHAQGLEVPVETARLQAPTSAAPEPPHVDIEPKNRPARLVSVEDHIRESDVFLARGALDEASNELKQALGKLGTATGTVRGEIYIRRGEVLRCQGNARLAISNFEKALTMLPDDERALLPMLDIFADEGNWRAMPALEQKLLASLALGTDLRFTRLLAFGDRWLESGRDSALAIERFSAARASSPQRREPIERLRALYEQQGDIEQTIALRGELAELTEDKVLRAGLYFELGQYCLRDAASEERGLAALELAIDTDSGRLDALELLATTLAENQEWAELERVYRKMVAALAASDDAPHKKLRAVLLRRLALLYRDHLEDVTLALGAIDEELALRATDEKLARSDDVLSAYLFGAALGRELDDAGRVLGYLRGAISRAPERHDTYHDLFALAERHGEPETSFLAASVAVTLGFANEAEQALYRREKLETVPTFTRVLSAESWGWLRTPAVRGHAAGDPDVDRVMKALAPALLRVRLAQLDLAGTPSTLPGLRQDPETSTATVVRTLAWAATQLDMVLPSVHIDDKSDALVEARVAAHQALVIGRSALSRRTVLELAFVASRHLAMRLPEHEVMAHCPSVAELSVSFLAAVKLVLGTAPGSATIVANAEALATLLATQITDAERRELEAAIMQLTSRGGALDLAAWGASVERCAARAGLLLSGSLETAIAMIRAEGDTAFSTASAKIADLCAFSVGAAFTKLRQRVGVSLVAR